MTENNYNKLIDVVCELVNLAWDSTSKEEFERLDNAGADIIDCLEKLQQFEAIGTVEEFNALKEKNTPYKPQEYEDKYYGCKCGEVLLEKWEVYPTKMMPKSWGLPYCMGCGQKLDWQ